MALQQSSHALAAVLVCPSCHADLEYQQNNVRCIGCQAEFVESGGVFIFSVPDTYDDETNHSKIPAAQQEWNALVATELQKLAEYGSTEVISRGQ